MASTHVSCTIKAPPSVVYRALLDPDLVQQWRVPDGMTSKIHVFEPKEGGAVRVSLTYEDPSRRGKSAARTDTYHGRFLKLIPNQLVIELDEFETSDPALQGEMISTIALTEGDGYTTVDATHDGLPPAVHPADNELGWRLALAKLKTLLESPEERRGM